MPDNPITKLDIKELKAMDWFGHELVLQKDGGFKCQRCTFEMPYCGKSMAQNKTFRLLTIVIAMSIWIGWTMHAVYETWVKH